MPSVAAVSVEQHLSLVEEVSTATGFIRAGLRELQTIDGANQFYRLPMTLLAQGFERLMKLAIALVELEDNGRLPTSNRMKNYFGHDLQRLVSECAHIASRPSYESRPAAAADARWLAADEFLRVGVAAISAFGGNERYAELGRFLGDPEAAPQDPQARVSALEMAILERHPEWQRQLAQPGFAGFYADVVAELTATAQRLGRAVSRFFVWGPAGDLGRAVSGQLHPLLFLRDDELGHAP